VSRVSAKARSFSSRRATNINRAPAAANARAQAAPIPALAPVIITVRKFNMGAP
jgi:hypothetical protein